MTNAIDALRIQNRDKRLADYQAELAALRAENARLREALAAIPLQPFHGTNNGERWDEGYRSGWNAALNGAHEIARAALKGAE